MLTPDEGHVVCACIDLTYGDLQRAIAAQEGTDFESILRLTGAGQRCTACLLDLEYHFACAPRAAAPSAPVRRAHGPAKLPLRRRLYRAVDAASPMVPFPLQEWSPVLVGPGIRQWMCVANDALLYGEEQPPEVQVALRVRDAEGRVIHEEVERVPGGGFMQKEMTRHLSSGSGALTIGSVEMNRRWPRPTTRGTTRPQILIETERASCAVHTQGQIGAGEGWFTALHRPGEERQFVAIVNCTAGVLSAEIAYPFDADGVGEHAAAHPMAIPPFGARLHEVVFSGPASAAFVDRPFGLRCRGDGAQKRHFYCATPALDRFSVDHFGG